MEGGGRRLAGDPDRSFDADAGGEAEELKKHITTTVERAGKGVRSDPKWRYHHCSRIRLNTKDIEDTFYNAY